MDLVELVDLTALVSSALAPGRGHGQRISGTRELPAGARVGLLDMVVPEAPRNSVSEPLVPKVRTSYEDQEFVHDGQTYVYTLWWREVVRDAHGDVVMVPLGDQRGHPPIAAVLDQWVQDWLDHRSAGENLPNPDVATLADWLRARCDWACDEHPAVDEFATEIRAMLKRLRTALSTARFVIRLGRPCPSCDLKTLTRISGSDKVRCGNEECRRVWHESEYERLARVLASAPKDAA